MRSLPSASQAGSPMVPIQGAPPSLDNMPGGCAFHPRCNWARGKLPPRSSPPCGLVEGGRWLACDIDPLHGHEPDLAEVGEI